MELCVKCKGMITHKEPGYCYECYEELKKELALILTKYLSKSLAERERLRRKLLLAHGELEAALNHIRGKPVWFSERDPVAITDRLTSAIEFIQSELGGSNADDNA